MDEEDDDEDDEFCLCRYFGGIGMNDADDGNCFCVFGFTGLLLVDDECFCVRNFDIGTFNSVDVDEDDDCFGIDDLL